MAKRLTHRVYRHLDSRRAPVEQNDGIVKQTKFDGPSVYGITVQAPRLGAEVQGLVQKSTGGVWLYSSPKYRAGAGIELVASYAGIENPSATAVRCLDGMVRGPIDTTALKEIQKQYGPDQRDEMESAIIAYCANPENLHLDDSTEHPLVVGQRYLGHVVNRSVHLNDLADGQEGAVLSMGHEPCVTQMVMNVTGLDYDPDVFGGPAKTGDHVEFVMEQSAPGELVKVTIQYRDLKKDYTLPAPTQ